MIQVGANEEMAIRMKFNEIYLDLKVYLYIGRRRGSIRGGRPREKSLKILGKTGNPQCDSRGKHSRLGLARYELLFMDIFPGNGAIPLPFQ